MEVFHHLAEGWENLCKIVSFPSYPSAAAGLAAEPALQQHQQAGNSTPGAAPTLTWPGSSASSLEASPSTVSRCKQQVGSSRGGEASRHC